MSRTNHQPGLPRDKKQDLTYDRRPNSKQAIGTEPHRNSDDGEQYARIHPDPRKDNYRDEDKPNSARILLDFRWHAINVTEYRNGDDEVNPTKNRTFGGISDH